MQPRCLGILIIQLHPGIGHHPQHRHPGQLFQHGEPRLKQRNIPPEFIDDGARNTSAFLRLQQRHRTIELGKYPAGVNVPHQQHRRIYQLCKAHVDDIICLQIDLRRTARTFDHDDIILTFQTVVGRHNIRDQLSLHLEIVPCPIVTLHLTVYDHLTAHIAGGLEQNGIHTDIRRLPCGLCLKHLGPAHLPAVRRHKAVEGHILALKGSHRPAVLMKDPAQCRHQQALSRPGHGTLNHDIPFHLPVTSFSTARSRKFSFSVRTATRYQPGFSP